MLASGCGKDMLKDQFIIASVNRSGEEIKVDHDHRRVHWNGRVLLIRDSKDND